MRSSTLRYSPLVMPVLGALLAALAAPAGAQSAYDQLQEACRQTGGNCSPNVPPVSPPKPVESRNDRTSAPATRAPQAPQVIRPPTAEQQMRTQVTGMVVQGLLNALLSTDDDDDEEKKKAAAAQAAAERERQEALYRQQVATQVSAQRVARDAEVGKDLESMSAALADPWVGRSAVPPGPPAAPGPASTEGGTVGLFDPPANPFARPAGPTRAELASQRLARLATENADVAVLAGRLGELEDRLARAQAENLAARREARATARGLDGAAQELEAAVDAAYERGASLALTTLFHATPKAQARLDEVRSDSRAWNKLNEVLRSTAEPGYAIKEAAEKAENLKTDLERFHAARDYRQDALYLAKRLGGDYAEVGSNILASAQSVRTSLAAREAANRLLGDLEAQRQAGRVDSEYATLVREVKEARTAVARATGIERQDLIRTVAEPPRPQGLGSTVPNLLDN
jgi:hypothetical protein